MSHQIVWADIPVQDLDRAIAFYSAVLGAQVTREGGPGFSFGLFPHVNDSVSGCLYVPGPENAPSKTGPLVYLNAAGRIAEALQAVEAHGGEILQPVHKCGPHGFRAVLRDCEGNRIALNSPTA